MIIDTTKYWKSEYTYFLEDKPVTIKTREGILQGEYMSAVQAIVDAAFNENGEFTPESVYPAKVYAAILYFTDYEDREHMWELGTTTDFLDTINCDSAGLMQTIWEEADKEIDRRIDPMNKIVDYIGKLKTSTESVLKSLESIDKDFISSKIDNSLSDSLDDSDLD